MKPQPKEFERVKTDDFIQGVIESIGYEDGHEFKFKGNVTKHPGVRFMFRLDGYKDAKPSGWLKFMYAEKGNLYKKYIASLVEGAKPNMDFDIEQLRGMKVKILFKDSDDGKYQNVDTIRPVDGKIKVDPNFVAPSKEDEPPF